MSTVYYHQEIICLRTEQAQASELLLRQHLTYSLTDMLGSPQLFQDHLSALVKAKIAASQKLFKQSSLSAVFLNFTPEQIAHPNFREAIRQLSEIVNSTQSICIEITEDIQSSQWNLMHDNLNAAKESGLLIAIDDFGVGYSNFYSILSLAPELVKLDNRYINQALLGKREQRTFLRLIEFIQDLGSKVVVEGIECDKGKRLAKSSNAEFGQGYALHMPKAI